MSLRDGIGELIGKLWAPVVRAISHARHARMFHPVGHAYHARCEPMRGPYRVLAQELGDNVLARFSGALSKAERERFEVLGCALRFRAGEIGDGATEPADQDLLFATIRSPFTMFASPLFTDAHDFVTNQYWAVSPFEHPTLGRIELRLTPDRAPPHDEAVNRADRLALAVATGTVSFWLEARRTMSLRWLPVSRIVLESPAMIDQEQLHFDPFHDGAGLHPVGVVQAIRKAVYPASQDGRDSA